MKGTMGIFLAFVLVMIIGFFAVGFTSSIQEPTAGTQAAYQYDNLSQAIEISNTGMYALMLVLAMAMALSAILFLIFMVRKRG